VSLRGIVTFKVNHAMDMVFRKYNRLRLKLETVRVSNFKAALILTKIGKAKSK